MPTALDVRPEKTQAIEDGDFIVFVDTPVFKSHTTRDGHEIDEDALRRICQRCNDRIRDTGDFAPVVLRHTSDDGDRDPEVVGFAGPYRLGKVGRLDPKPAILAHLRIFKEDADKCRKYPRLSVEYWASEDDPTNGYFDPISLLGAETPELDLGVRYSRDAGGCRLMRYSRVERFQAAMPSPSMPGGSTNTYVPGGLSDDDKKKPYQKGAVMLSPEDIQQITQAMVPVIQEQIAAQLPAASATGLQDDEPDADNMGGEPDMDADDMGGDLPTADELADDEGEDLEGMEDDEDEDEDDEDEDDEEGEDEGNEKPDHYARLRKYACDGDEDSGKRYAKDLDDDSRAAVAARMDGEADEDVKMKLAKYMAMNDDEMQGDRNPAQQYRKERNKWRTRYQKARADHSQLRDKYAKLEKSHGVLIKEKRRAVRYAKLAELSQEGYLLDADDETEECESMTDSQFDRHCTRIKTKYQRVPLGSIPIPRSPMRDGVSKDEKRERYAKQAADNVLAARNRGETLEYKAELDRLMSASAG